MFILRRPKSSLKFGTGVLFLILADFSPVSGKAPSSSRDFGEIHVQSIGEKSNREVSAQATLPFHRTITQDQWRACVPTDSIAFPHELPKDLQDIVFRKNELQDLMKCDRDSCAFNFLPKEIEDLEKAEGEDQHKTLYWQFYKDRKNLKTPITKKNESHLIRSKDKAFDVCQAKPLAELLDSRPQSQFDWRLEVAVTDSRARPTTRLLQSTRFINESEKELCYAEALIFADHYDLDRIEVWSLKPGLITLQARHRLDFLHSWLRRLRKPELRKMIEDWAGDKLKRVQACLAESP